MWTPGAKGHQHEVGHCPIPHWNLDTLLLTVRSHRLDDLGLGGDGVNGAHEDVGDDVDCDKAVDEAPKVEAHPQPPRPGHLDEQWQEDSFL